MKWKHCFGGQKKAGKPNTEEKAKKVDDFVDVCDISKAEEEYLRAISDSPSKDE